MPANPVLAPPSLVPFPNVMFITSYIVFNFHKKRDAQLRTRLSLVKRFWSVILRLHNGELVVVTREKDVRNSPARVPMCLTSNIATSPFQSRKASDIERERMICLKNGLCVRNTKCFPDSPLNGFSPPCRLYDAVHHIVLPSLIWKQVCCRRRKSLDIY
jgi:hypothetical protein